MKNKSIISSLQDLRQWGNKNRTIDCGAVGEALSQLFGADYAYTDHSYDYLGMPSRSYNSFNDLFEEMINARIYAGIHTRIADIASVNQGRIIAQNIDSKLKFLKE